MAFRARGMARGAARTSLLLLLLLGLGLGAGSQQSPEQQEQDPRSEGEEGGEGEEEGWEVEERGRGVRGGAGLGEWRSAVAEEKCCHHDSFGQENASRWCCKDGEGRGGG
ncbi:hypothetical protein T484DRAFT_1909429, partial [Baffinella frigidus]